MSDRIEKLAKQAYEAYCATLMRQRTITPIDRSKGPVGGSAPGRFPLASWEEQRPEIRECWIEAVKSIQPWGGAEQVRIPEGSALRLSTATVTEPKRRDPCLSCDGKGTIEVLTALSQPASVTCSACEGSGFVTIK